MKKLISIIIGFISLLVIVGCSMLSMQIHASRGLGNLKNGNYDLAIKEYNIAKEYGEIPGIYLGLGRSYLEKGEKEKGIEFFYEGLNKYPNEDIFNYAIGTYYLYEEDDPTKALPFLIKAQNSINWDKLDLAVEEAQKKIEEANKSGSRGFFSPSPHNTLHAGPHRAFHQD